MFVVSRLVSTDYMCGLDLSGFLVETMAQNVSASLFGFPQHYLRFEGVTTVLLLLPLGPKCGVNSISS